MKTGERRQELDGVRGIAILLVLVGHTSYQLAPLAAAGVALFFALSGYLITSILLNERARRGQLNLRRFYARRFTRLAPPLFVMLAVMGVLLAAGWDVVAPLTWTANYAQVLGYGSPEFDHTWSLAVEEQFYLVWPITLLWLLRRRDPARTLTLVMGVLAAWWVVLIAAGHANYAYVALETAGVPILGGCLVALRGPGKPRPAAEPMVALLLLSVVAVVVDGERTWPVIPMLTVPFTIALVAAAHGSRWLAWRPLGACGVVSYSLYLWHLPVAWFLGGGIVTPVTVAAGAAVGVVAYVVVERPIMALRQRKAAARRFDACADLAPSMRRPPVIPSPSLPR